MSNRTVLKDIASWLLGVALIVHEVLFVPPADLRIEVLILGAVLSGVPGAGAVWAARSGTSGPPSEPPPSRSVSSSGPSGR